MKRLPIVVILSLLCALTAPGRTTIVVADSATRKPLPHASVFDRNGVAIGLSDRKGRLPLIAPACYPATVRYLGYREQSITDAGADTLFLAEITAELPEVLVVSPRHKVLHILAYMREYSNLSTYTDTVLLFREKMVDYMIPPDAKIRFQGWSKPRVLKSKSYYRFTDSEGLDSVSGEYTNHFSWSDWIGIVAPPAMPRGITGVENGTDTLRGKYSPTEIWTRTSDKVSVNVDVLADVSSSADATKRKWVPDLSAFFRKRLDFESFRMHFNYGNVAGDSLALTDLTGYSFQIESNGRGLDMFMFNYADEPICVNTFAEVYILDKEYLTVKEARKWAKMDFAAADIAIIEPPEAPPLQSAVRELVARVEAVDPDEVRLHTPPDQRLVGPVQHQQNIAQRALSLLRQATGITSYKARKKFNYNWDSFREKQLRINRRRDSKKIPSPSVAHGGKNE